MESDLGKMGRPGEKNLIGAVTLDLFPKVPPWGKLGLGSLWDLIPLSLRVPGEKLRRGRKT